MKKQILLTLLISTIFSCISKGQIPNVIIENDSKTKTIQYKINRNEITFRIILNLLERELKYKPRPNPVRSNLKNYFSNNNDHSVFKLARRITYDDQISGYLLHKQEFPEYGDKYDFSPTLKQMEIFGLVGIEPTLDSLYKELYSFYKEAKVEKFIEDNLIYYNGAINEIRKIAKQYNIINQLEEYTNQSNAGYVISPEPLFLTGSTRGIGPSVNTDHGVYAFQFVSPSKNIDLSNSTLDRMTEFGYNDKEYIRQLCTHEFAHTFINPSFFNQEIVEFINSSDSLFTNEIKKKLRGSGVGNFFAYMIEHVVRLLEIRIAEIYVSAEEAESIRHKNKNFIYLAAMEKNLIENFEENREKYPKYSDFIFELLKVIEYQ